MIPAACKSASICSQVPQTILDVHCSAGKLHQLDAVQLLECWVSDAWPPQFCHFTTSPHCLTGLAKVPSACRGQTGRWLTWPLPGPLQRLLWTACCSTAGSPLTLLRLRLLRRRLWPRMSLKPSAHRKAMSTAPLGARLSLLDAVPPAADQVLTATACGCVHT